jgi:hypothetical protein
MSAEFENLVGRAVMDAQFRDGLLADTEATLQAAGFVLSESERAQLLDGITKMNTQSASDGPAGPSQLAPSFW